MKTKTYTELKKLKTFKERYEYLKLKGVVGESTFGFDRYINQELYRSGEWRIIRDRVIIRDLGCDLGIEGHEVHDKVIVHHMNPISQKDILEKRPLALDPEYLITTSYNTHQAIHFGDEKLLPKEIVVRKKNDTVPWK
jgi:hypothetical protein